MTVNVDRLLQTTTNLAAIGITAGIAMKVLDKTLGPTITPKRTRKRKTYLDFPSPFKPIRGKKVRLW